MTQLERFIETIAKYRQFDWRVRRVLLSGKVKEEIDQTKEATGQRDPVDQRDPLGQPDPFEGATIAESEVDAIWFSRPSHAGREAWELRLVAETPYALFETFEPDEPEDEREEVRLDMEARLRDHVRPPHNPPSPTDPLQ
jgi:hypothetical protein